MVNWIKTLDSEKRKTILRGLGIFFLGIVCPLTNRTNHSFIAALSFLIFAIVPMGIWFLKSQRFVRFKPLHRMMALGVVTIAGLVFLFSGNAASSREIASLAKNYASDYDGIRPEDCVEEIHGIETKCILGNCFMLGYTPKQGKVYANERGFAQVVSTTDDGWVIIRTPSMTITDSRTLAILTPRVYADGELLAAGRYRCIGVKRFNRVSGTATNVYTFREL